MKKALSLAAVTAAAALAIAWVPRQPQAAVQQVDQVAVDAQIDARLHALLGRMITQSRQGADEQLAIR